MKPPIRIQKPPSSAKGGKTIKLEQPRDSGSRSGGRGGRSGR